MGAEHGGALARRQQKPISRIPKAEADEPYDYFLLLNPSTPPNRMKPTQLKQLSNLCFILGFASIVGSITIWFLTGGQAPETQAHAERFGIFVGLWAPTFFILSNRFDRYAEKVG